MGNFLKKVLKKGITKDYEVESLILNENTNILKTLLKEKLIGALTVRK